MSEDNSYMLFAGTSHRELSQQLAGVLKKPLAKVHIEAFPDGEIGVQVLENVRGRDVFVFQTIAIQPNHYLMELLIMVDALKRASARTIGVVIPYYGYARQDRRDEGRVPITAKLVANLLEKAGVTRVLTMDLHTEQIQGFFDIPVDNLYARPILIDAVKKLGLDSTVVVSPDVGSNKMAGRFAKDLQVDLAIVDKRRVSADKVEANALIGDIKDKNVVIVDDICSTGGTLKTAVRVCKQAGAKEVYAAITHGLFLNASVLDGINKLFVTNSIPNPILQSEESIEVISIANLMGGAIECLTSAGSISSLYNSY